jgi:hypothetical protein
VLPEMVRTAVSLKSKQDLTAVQQQQQCEALYSSIVQQQASGC